jgi:hypothetical protein
MEQITLSREVAQALIAYLQTKPYVEVYQLIDVLLKSAALQPEAAPSDSEI